MILIYKIKKAVRLLRTALNLPHTPEATRLDSV